MRIDNAIQPIQSIINPAGNTIAKEKGGDFGNLLMDAIKEVSSIQKDARNKQNLLMTNRPVDVDDLMVSMEKASVSMQLTMQVRNKLLEAYQEVARMQI